MTKTETRLPGIGHDVRNLRDDELEAVTGAKGAGSWLEALAKAMGEAADKQAEKLAR